MNIELILNMLISHSKSFFFWMIEKIENNLDENIYKIE